MPMIELGPYEILRIVVGFSAIASIIGALEWIALRGHLRDDQIYSWQVQKAARPAGSGIDRLLAYPTVLAVPAAEVFLSLALLAPGLPQYAAGLCCLGVAFCYFLLSLRGIDGFNGGDAMAKVVMLVGAICFLSGSETLIEAGLWFMAGQLLIAYSTPGWCRLFDRDWHNATKILGVMRTETFGRVSVWTLLRDNPRFARLVSSGIAIWEALFVLYLFLPIELLIPVLLIGVVFHSSNAIVMGLNIFPWSFLGAYPAFIWTALQIQRLLY